MKIGQRIDGDKWVIGYGDGKIVTVDANNTIGFLDYSDWIDRLSPVVDLSGCQPVGEPPAKKAKADK